VGVEGWKTAMARTSPSAPMRWLHQHGHLVGDVLDFGCGRGYDAMHFGLDAYDPHWGPELPDRTWDTITCLYVLNVLPITAEDAVLSEVLDLLNPGGCAYFAIRRDIKKETPGRGCTQRPVNLPYDLIHSDGSMGIYQTCQEVW